MNNIKIGVAAIIEKDGKILFGKRVGSHGYGTWGFIGGHLEFGESFTDCIKREAKEEAGVELIEISHIETTEDIFSEDKHYITIFMKASIADISKLKVLEPDKMSDWKWFAKDNIPENMFLPIKNLINKGYKF